MEVERSERRADARVPELEVDEGRRRQALLDEQRDSPIFVGTRQFPVRQCLWIIINEEWHHRLYAERDLDARVAVEQ